MFRVWVPGYGTGLLIRGEVTIRTAMRESQRGNGSAAATSHVCNRLCSNDANPTVQYILGVLLGEDQSSHVTWLVICVHAVTEALVRSSGGHCITPYIITVPKVGTVGK